MSLFLPSQLSPNFEEVTIDEPLFFQFQVNTNGSQVRSYKLEILNDKNDAEDPDDNILATFYGVFDTPLYNKEIGYIIITKDQLNSKGLILSSHKDYRWRIRLYEDNVFIHEEQITNYSGMSINGADYYIEDSNMNTIRLIFNYNKPEVISHLIQKNGTDEQELIYVDNRDYVDINIDRNDTIFMYSEYNEDLGQEIFYSGNFSMQYYRVDTIEHQYGSTYVGEGNLVGSTKNIIWLTNYDQNIKEDLYVQTYCASNDPTNDFRPFKNDNQTGRILGLVENNDNDDYIDKIKIDPSEILPVYKKKFSDGNMYFCISTDGVGANCVIEDYYLKLITGLTYEDGATYINIDSQQAYSPQSINDAKTYSLIYVQRQKIYSVDKGIGQQQLVKVTLDEPLDYNISHNTKVEVGLQSDNFDYDRVYIQPIEEFDNKTSGAGISYINIAYTEEDLIQTHNSGVLTNWTKSDLEEHPNCRKIINYVGTTGEVTLFSNLDFMPDRFYMYQIFDIVDGTVSATSDGTYQYIGGVYKNSDGIYDNRYFLGGGILYNYAAEAYPYILPTQQSPEFKIGSDQILSIYSNHKQSYRHEIDDDIWNFYSVFIQPNSGIYEDFYKPCKLDLYNNTVQQSVYITNSLCDLEEYDKFLSIDILDDSQWLVTLVIKNEEIDDKLLFSQSKYKIYTNFVNSIPEGYFYVRPKKELSFEFYNIYDDTSEITTSLVNDKLAIPAKDILIKCDIHDDGSLGNMVPIKLYKYIVSANKNGQNYVVYESDNIYDGKMEYTLRGLETCLNKDNEFANNIFYTVQIIVQDDYNKEYSYSKSFYANYQPNVDYDNMSVTVDPNLQCIHIDFSPIKDFIGEVKVEHNELATIATSDGAWINNSDGLTFQYLDNNEVDQISIPNEFVIYFRMKISESLFEKECGIYNIFEIETDNKKKYKIDFDTRPYYYENKTFYNNENYLSFYCYEDDEVKQTITISNIYGDDHDFTLPSGFKYFISEDTIDNNAIYLISDNANIVEEYGGERTKYIGTVYNGYMFGDDDKLPDFIYSNDKQESYFNEKNKEQLTMLFFKIDSSVQNNKFQISTTIIQ